jgi:hypothetical protein
VSFVLKWNSREEKKGFRNNCLIAVGISTLGIILAVLS